MPYVAITLLVVFGTNFRLSLSQSFLSNLTVYRIPAKDETPKQPLKTSQARNRQKRLNRKKSEENLQGQLCLIPTTGEGLLQRAFFSDFDKLVFFATTVVTNLVAFQLVSWLKDDLRGGSVLTCLAVIAGGCGIVSLVRTQINTEVSPREEQLVGGAAAIASGMMAALVLLLVPSEVLDFELEGAAQAVTLSLQLQLEKLGHESVALAVKGATVFPLVFLQGVLVGLAAVIGGVSVAPAVRCGRCYMLSTSPPDWAEGHLGEGRGRRVLLHINTILPMAVIVLWIRPMLEEPLGLSAEHILYLRIGAVILAAVMQGALLRTHVQSFLDSGFVAWYERLYGNGVAERGAPSGTRQGAEANMYSQVVRCQLDLNSTLMCKVAVQAFAPGVILLSCAALMWHKGVMTKDHDTNSLLPPILFKSIFSFIAWWFCGLWTLFSSVTLGLFRYGQLT